jgi:lysozyme
VLAKQASTGGPETVTASECCLSKLKELEGYTPVARHLPGNRANVITGGYGETQVKPGETHTEPEWEAKLRARVAEFAGIVNSAVNVPLAQSQFDALVLFVYNVEPGNPHTHPPIEGLLTSTLLKLLNAGDMTGASNEFVRWDRADGKPLAGLTTRRLFERSWFVEAA